MDNSEFIIPVTNEEAAIYGNVNAYQSVDDEQFDVYTSSVVLDDSQDVAGLKVTECLFDVKIEPKENATDDESMAVEALRQLGNSSYTRIETNTPLDLPLLPCSTCDMEFRTTADLNNHAEICKHSQYVCQICQQVFDRKIELNNHLVCHAVDRPHSCRICGTLFIHKQDLVLHTATHTTAGNQCQVCGLEFQRPSSLTNHMKIHNYQPGRALNHSKIEDTAELADILKDEDLDIAEEEVVTLPSISHIASLNNHWNLDPPAVVEETVPAPAPEVVVNKRPYACTKCTKTFTREKALNAHMLLHKDVLDSYVCERCDQDFDNVELLAKHKERCGVKLSTKQMRQKQVTDANKQNNNNHVDSAAYNRVYKHKCNECGKCFTTNQKLFRHNWIHRKKTYACELCNETYDEQKELDNHRLATHQSGSPYVCFDCGKNFSSRQGLWEHNRTHTIEENSFKCADCGKKFTSRQGYVIHLRKHTDERPYGCRYCLKAFRDGGTLRKHERIHTGERPHACPLCAKTFNQKVVLREHLRGLHTTKLEPDEDGYYSCNLCDDKYNDKDVLCAHFVRHSDIMAQLARDASKNNIKTDENVIVGSTVDDQLQAVAQNYANNTTVVALENELNVAALELQNDTQLEEISNSTLMEVQNHYRLINGNDKGAIIAESTATIDDTLIQCDMCGLCFETKQQLTDHITIHI